MATRNFYEQVYELVRRIPAGRVTTYGRVAQMLGRPNAARAVGYALSALGEQDTANDPVPWQRVINAQGRISIVNREVTAQEQAALLRAEGIAVSKELKVNLERYLWEGLHWVEIDDIINS